MAKSTTGRRRRKPSKPKPRPDVGRITKVAAAATRYPNALDAGLAIFGLFGLMIAVLR